tara:strand:- start:601 stop:1020 length:420 start_codon:yes stop_codon:yes gene_type:complete
LNNKLVIGITLISILITACAASNIKEYVGPDGKSIKTVKCNQHFEECFELASSSCSGGTYQVINSESHAGGLLSDILAGPVTWYGMTYYCGASDGKMPNFIFSGPQYTLPAPPIKVEVTTKLTTTNCTKTGNNTNCTTY